jgi:excisionase family DNA binding protein
MFERPTMNYYEHAAGGNNIRVARASALATAKHRKAQSLDTVLPNRSDPPLSNACFSTMPHLLQGRAAISIADAAIVLGVGRTTLYRLLKDAELMSIRIGRRNLVLTSSVLRLIKGASDDE